MTNRSAKFYVIAAVIFGICGNMTSTMLGAFCNGVFCHNWLLPLAALPFALLCCAFFIRQCGACLLLILALMAYGAGVAR